MKRRNFLKSLLAFLGATALVSFSYPLLRFLAPPGGEAKTQKITISKKEIPIGEAKAIIVNNVPALLINRSDKGYIALSRVCTHLGCLVEYDRGKHRLICPCHAGIYDLEGSVVSGPPPAPLAKIALRVDGDNIVIG